MFSKSAAILSDFNADDSFDTDTEVVVGRCVDDGMVVKAEVETDRDASSMAENFMIIVFCCVMLLQLLFDG